MDASSDPSDRRARAYRRFARRNRLIGWLRIGVPMFGALVLAVLLAEIFIANMARDFGISGVRIARDELVIDTPEYSGVMANGTLYTVVAEAASTAIGGADVLKLQDPLLDLTRIDGYRMRASAKTARFSLDRQTVEVDDVLNVSDSSDMQAKLLNAIIDWRAQTLIAKDNVHVVFADGSILTGSALHYDAGTQIWDFDNVKLTLAAEETDQ